MAALYFDATGLAYSFDDGHIAVRTVHSVKHVPTHQSNITDTTEVTLSVNNDATDLSRVTTPSAGTPRQICRDFRHRQPPQSLRPGLRIRGPGLRRWFLDGPWFCRPGFRRWVSCFSNVANICHIPKTALPYSYSGSPVPPERCSQSRFQYPRPS